MDLFLITNCAPARHHYEKTKKQKTKLKNFFFFSFGCVYVWNVCDLISPYFILLYILYIPASPTASHFYIIINVISPSFYKKSVFFFIFFYAIIKKNKKTNPKLGEEKK